MAASALAPLLALAGQCFAGEVAPATRDLHCFSAIFGGRHVRDVHRVTVGGRTVYEGESLYSAEGPAVTFVYISSLGGIGHGTAAMAGGDWRFRLSMRATPLDAPVAMATRWHWQNADRYRVMGGPAPVTYQRIAATPER